MRRALRCLPLLLVAACTRTGPQRKPNPPEGAPPAFPTSATLAGREIATLDAGPWTVRRVAVRDAEAAKGDALGSAGRRHGGGAAPPAGGPVPAPTTAAPSAPPPPTSPMPAPRDAAEADGGRSVAPASGADAKARPGETARGRQGTPLRAGSTDDNEDFDAFLKFLAAWGDRPTTAPKHDVLDVSDRRFIAVVDAQGRPWPGARVRVADESRDRVAWTATTYGDGRTPFYPRVADRDLRTALAGKAPSGGWVVEVEAGGAHASARWDGTGDVLTVPVAATRPEGAVPLDVAIVLDTTGSMGDEIDRIKATLASVVARVREAGPGVDLRFGAVVYRDLGDDYVTMRHGFTGDVAAFQRALTAVSAAGGGDYAESMNQGLAEAVGRLDWRAGAAKVAFLIADAPPHTDYAGDVPYGTSLVAAVGEGIRVHAVAASGLDDFGTLVFRQAAQLTRGKFVFIEYGDLASTAASHGVGGRVQGNNLDDILVGALRAEIEGWGRAPTAPSTAPAPESAAPRGR
ncbi:MAG: VWA domain-containing protein [Planctomycetes bacterium]|nr:VWA domain-containing protein [Planctomycetota bacterium]